MNATNIWHDSGGRSGHLLALMDYSSTDSGGPILDKRFADVTIAGFMAWRDFQERRGEILPHLPALLQDCDFKWTLEIRDSQASPLVGVKQVLKAMAQKRKPFAVAGPVYSRVGIPVNYLLGNGYAMPQISGLTTSPALDGATLFARTIATDRSEAEAIMTYFRSIQATRVATIFMSDDTYGVEFSVDLQQAGLERGISVEFFAIQRGKTEAAIFALKAADIRYVVPIKTGDWWQEMFSLAYQHQVMGYPGYAWLVPASSDWDDPQLGFDRKQEKYIAKAMHGVGYSQLHLEVNRAYDAAFGRFAESLSDQGSFLSCLAQRDSFLNYSFSGGPDVYHYYYYDAVIALGLAACGTSGLFTGEELHAQLLNTSFMGVSGEVSFNPSTGTRSSTTSMYHIKNLVLSDSRSTDSIYYFNSQLAAVVMGADVQVQNAFVYADNSTNPPAALPLIQDYNYHLIPLGLQILGLCLGAVSMLVSILLIVWTIRYRKKFIVHAGQPIFLHQLCIGTLVMASATIPMSMQGTSESPGLDAACMSSLWLVLLGLVMAISSIGEPGLSWEGTTFCSESNTIMCSLVTPSLLDQQAKPGGWT
jgi:ABC-type branched-subunit amino acid transport system substrate-binding protein